MLQNKNKQLTILDIVSRETLERLEEYVTLLKQWNERINIISSKDVEQVWTRHILDSLQLVPFVQSASSIIDLGSGGGFPGMVLSIATDIPMVLIESDTRKAIFLREVARQLNCQAKVICQRIETIVLPPAEVITARALAPLDKLFSLSLPLLQPNGFCLFLKGKQSNQEIAQAEKQWTMQYSQFPSQTNSEGVILKVSKIKRVTES